MTTETQELQAIHMSIKTADLNMIGFSCEERIILSCGLMNIGRGICSVRLNHPGLFLAQGITKYRD